MRTIKLSYSIYGAVTFLLLASITILGSDQVPAPKQDHPIALIGGIVHTVSGDVIEGGTVLFDGGKITAVGEVANLPAGTEEIDVSGKHVYPGLISAHTRLGLIEIGAVQSTRDMTEMGSMNPSVRAEVAINPDSELLPVARANGITIANSVPSGGILSGKSAAIMLDGWTWESMTLKAPVAMHMNWPRMSHVAAWWYTKSKEEQDKERKENLNRIRDFFDAARAYMKAMEAAGARGIPRQEVDVGLEAMIPVLKGELPVWFHVNRVKQIQACLDFAEEEGIKAVIVGGADALMVAGELKAADVPVVVSPILASPSRSWEGYDDRYTLPLRLNQAGVRYCIADGASQGNERNLSYHAAMAVAFGLPEEEGIKAITLYPAQIMGIDDRVGSIDVGKDATLIVTDGNPLEITTDVELEFIQGRNIDLGNKHKTLYEKYREKYIQKGLIE